MQFNSGHKGIPHFLSHSIPLSRASPHCSPASAFCLQHTLSFAHDPKPQHPMHPFLPFNWHWTPQSTFQSLNTDLACGETDSYSPVLRKIFRQGKLITSVTVVSLLTEIEGTTTKSMLYSSQNYPERCDMFIFLLLPQARNFKYAFSNDCIILWAAASPN